MAAAAGEALFDETLHSILTAALRTPPETAISTIVEAHRRRGAHVPLSVERRLLHLTQALWWARYANPEAPTQLLDTHVLVDDILLPLIGQPVAGD